MTNGGGESGGALRRRRLIVGALLVVVVLFHDLAMTADAHVEADPPHEARALHARHGSVPAEIDGARAAIHDPIGGSCGAETCRPPGDCTVGVPGILTTAGHRAPVALVVAADVPDASATVRVPRPDLDLGATPVLPPSVRRALLQVFLI